MKQRISSEIELVLKIPSRNFAIQKYNDHNIKTHERGSNRKREIETGMRKNCPARKVKPLEIVQSEGKKNEVK